MQVELKNWRNTVLGLKTPRTCFSGKQKLPTGLHNTEPQSGDAATNCFYQNQNIQISIYPDTMYQVFRVLPYTARSRSRCKYIAPVTYFDRRSPAVRSHYPYISKRWGSNELLYRLRNSDGWRDVLGRLFRTKSVMGPPWDDYFGDLGCPPKFHKGQDACFDRGSSS